MPSTFEFCLPTRAAAVPDRPVWLHEVKYDGISSSSSTAKAVVLGVDGISDFDGLHSGKFNDEVQLYAFDILALDGEDLRRDRLLVVHSRTVRNASIVVWAATP